MIQIRTLMLDEYGGVVLAFQSCGGAVSRPRRTIPEEACDTVPPGPDGFGGQPRCVPQASVQVGRRSGVRALRTTNRGRGRGTRSGSTEASKRETSIWGRGRT